MHSRHMRVHLCLEGGYPARCFKFEVLPVPATLESQYNEKRQDGQGDAYCRQQSHKEIAPLVTGGRGGSWGKEAS